MPPGTPHIDTTNDFWIHCHKLVFWSRYQFPINSVPIVPAVLLSNVSSAAAVAALFQQILSWELYMPNGAGNVVGNNPTYYLGIP